MAYKPNDHFARKAKKEQFVARSVYKLMEIDRKYRLLHKGDRVLDLGASPGSWSQYAAGLIGEKGKLLGIDLTYIAMKLPNAVFIKGDILTLDMNPLLETKGFTEAFDVVLSDMAPATTANRFVDQMRSLELCEMALDTSLRFLRKGGHFVTKIFDSGEAMGFRDRMREHFEKVHIVRPKSVQKSSKEIYLIGLKRRGN